MAENHLVQSFSLWMRKLGPRKESPELRVLSLKWHLVWVLSDGWVPERDPLERSGSVGEAVEEAMPTRLSGALGDTVWPCRMGAG